jgi:nucleoside-diphosphate-sugar epimerase
VARYLVTGGAGFIGSNIVEELVRRGAKVRVLDSLITGNMDNLRPFAGKVDFIKGDIRDRPMLKRAMKGVDYVMHQAALRSVPKSVDDPFTTNDINVSGTLSLLFEAKAAGVSLRRHQKFSAEGD